MTCCGSTKVEPEALGANFKGPVSWSQRRCRDFFMLLLFVAYWVGLVVVAIYALLNGDPYRMIYGHDSFGNTCARKNPTLFPSNSNDGLDLRGFDRLFYFHASDSPATLQLCVSSCPEEDNFEYDLLLRKEYSDVPLSSGLCLNSANISANPYSSDAFQWNLTWIDDRGCPQEVWSSVVLLNRCVPVGESGAEAVNAVVDEIDSSGTATAIYNDMEATYREILILLGLAVVVSFVFVLLMRFLAFIVIWLLYTLMILLTLVSIAAAWYLYHQEREEIKEYEDKDLTPPTNAERNLKIFLAGAILWTVVGTLILMFLLYIRKSISLVVALFREAGDCLRQLPLLLLYPILTLIGASIVLIYFLVVGLYLWSSGDAYELPEYQHVEFRFDNRLQAWGWYHLFGFYWTFELVLAFEEAVVAGCVAEWYFTRNKKKMSWTIMKSIARTLRFSLGSVIFGALVIAIISLIRTILYVVEQRVKKLDPSSHVGFVLRCINCCLWCFQKILKFLNRNAFIEIAIFGNSFCTSAWNAFKILTRNALRVAIINSVGDFVLFIAKLVVLLLVAIAAVFLFDRHPEELTYEAVIIGFLCLFAYLIASMFFGIYEMTIDTLFVCFCEDSERNDGSDKKPYFMSRRLLKFMAREERRAQKRTEEAYKRQQHKAELAKQKHEEAMKNNIMQEDLNDRASYL
eukprot:m.42752 g.42752  ORF g.42752 m.42752 type:complete len:686 (+) comp9908_c0_seq2:368-2425(+)